MRFASAAAILAMSKATGETEHLKDMLVGNILAVSRYEVTKTASLYGCVWTVSLHFPQEKFFGNSPSAIFLREADLNFRLWGLSFFYAVHLACSDVVVAIARKCAVFLLFVVPSWKRLLFPDRMALAWRLGGQWGLWSRR